MLWLLSFCLILCFASPIQTQTIYDYDCDVPPPLDVEPLTCCQINKPFDIINFPDCFTDLVSTPPPPTTTLASLPSTINVVDIQVNDNDPDQPQYDDDYRQNNNNNNRRGGTGRGDSQEAENSGEGGHWPKKHHWNWGFHNHRHDRHSNYGGYHRFGGFHGGRYRRQTFYRVNAPRICAIECIFNQTNILVNDRFDRNIALEVYSDLYNEIPIDLLTRSVDKCFKQFRNYQIAKRVRNRNQQIVNLNRRCVNGAGLFAACFNREIYRNCPAQLDDNSDDCATLRAFIDNCSPLRQARNIGNVDNVDVDENGNIIPDDG